MHYVYSKSCEYAIRLLVVAAKDDKKRFSVKNVCRRAGVSEPYARKALQKLVKKKVLFPFRGPGGGYQLSVSPGKITILEIIEAIDGKAAFDECVMGLSRCGKTNPCPLHDVWMRVKDKYILELSRIKISDLVKKNNGRKTKR